MCWEYSESKKYIHFNYISILITTITTIFRRKVSPDIIGIHWAVNHACVCVPVCSRTCTNVCMNVETRERWTSDVVPQWTPILLLFICWQGLLLAWHLPSRQNCLVSNSGTHLPLSSQHWNGKYASMSSFQCEFWRPNQFLTCMRQTLQFLDNPSSRLIL